MSVSEIILSLQAFVEGLRAKQLKRLDAKKLAIQAQDAKNIEKLNKRKEALARAYYLAYEHLEHLDEVSVNKLQADFDKHKAEIKLLLGDK